MSDSEWMTTAEVAKALGVRVSTVNNLVSRGRLDDIERIPGAGRKTSLFLRAEVEAEVARRAAKKNRSHRYSWERS